MSPPRSVYVSKSTLLHTSLAYISPELMTMDYVIQNQYRPSNPERRMLPPEILLLIREWLLQTVTAQLIKRSTHALMAYEQSLRDLLCADCISYNLDIYGPDIWQWDQFNAACSCAESAESSVLLDSRISGGRGKHSYPTREATPTPGAGILDPKQFVDSSHWLESHLSMEAALRGYPRGLGHAEASEYRPAPATNIWDAVSSMLRDYQCETFPVHEESARSHNRLVRRQLHFQYDVIQISPLPLQRATRSFEDASYEETDRHTQIILQRAMREMGLLINYSEEYSVYGSHLVALPHLRWPNVSNACYKRQDILDLSKTLAQFLVSLTVGCLSVPITFATLAVTIVCFYSRPRGFRVF